MRPVFDSFQLPLSMLQKTGEVLRSAAALRVNSCSAHETGSKLLKTAGAEGMLLLYLKRRVFCSVLRICALAVFLGTCSPILSFFCAFFCATDFLQDLHVHVLSFSFLLPHDTFCNALPLLQFASRHWLPVIHDKRHPLLRSTCIQNFDDQPERESCKRTVS